MAEGRGDAALGHHRVRLAEERLADEADVRAGGLRLDRGPQSGAAGPDDEDVVPMRLERSHRGSTLVPRTGSPGRSRTPSASRWMYRSATTTEIRLAQAQTMWRSLSPVSRRHAE